MKRVLIGLSLVVFTVIMVFGSTGVSAQEKTQPAPATYALGALLRVKLTLPYAWIRSAPSSNGAVIDTAQRAEFVIIASPAPSWDGVQWWWAVRRGNGNATGWIEQNSIESATAPPPTSTTAPVPPTFTATPGTGPTVAPVTQTPATWSPETVLTLAPGVTFAWMRDDALSNANFRATVFPGQLLYVQGGTGLPRFDGIQYWWLVHTVGSTRIGWIEQKSLALYTGALTATPTSSGNTTVSWALGTTLTLKPGVPYVLLRTGPHSTDPARAAAYPTAHLTVRDATAQWDGVQWWWLVNFPSLNVYGWVEQNSLMEAPNPPTATSVPGTGATSWSVGTIVQSRGGIAFVWVRTAPSSTASVRDTVQPGSLMQTTGNPQWDGVQWWWPVRLAFAYTTGWVEQNSLVALMAGTGATTAAKGGSAATPTLGPTTTPTSTPTVSG